MCTNMGGGLPISGFYEMKQEIYEIYKRLSGKKYISELFSVEPETWGLRGDPYLWKYLKDRLSTTVVPENESELKALLINDIEEVIHAELTDHSETYVEDFAHGGMSSGYVSGQFWLKRGIPMLCERLKACRMQTKTGLRSGCVPCLNSMAIMRFSGKPRDFTAPMSGRIPYLPFTA